uniref:Uncharacterized protein n=1 Tax=Ralstonia solanacearum CFBP2957 TaxID=859656 RepID=D8P683_RALSL|nr:protein of unknown function [Ralstonia solanacearum CFBP2957]
MPAYEHSTVATDPERALTNTAQEGQAMQR